MLAFYQKSELLDIIGNIIQFGIKITKQDFNGNTVLHIAAMKGHTKIMD